MQDFTSQKHIVVKEFMDPHLCRIFLDYVELKVKTDGLVFNNEPNFVPNSMTFYADQLNESLLLNFQPKMEELTGLDLFPTYSFLRLYKEGDRLPKHKDRLSCQIAVSLCIGYSYDDAEYQWPFVIEDEEVLLKPGDALIYRGTEELHWRQELERDWHLQTFLFYVDQSADFAETLKYDSRPDLGLPKSEMQIDIRKYESEYYTSRGYIDLGRVTYHD